MAIVNNQYDLGFTSNGLHVRVGNYTGDTASTGVLTIPTGLKNVLYGFVGYYTAKNLDTMAITYDTALSATLGSIKITVKKMRLDATRTWGNCADGDVTAMKNEYLVFGE